jgi:hypothetical protein
LFGNFSANENIWRLGKMRPVGLILNTEIFRFVTVAWSIRSPILSGIFSERVFHAVEVPGNKPPIAFRRIFSAPTVLRSFCSIPRVGVVLKEEAREKSKGLLLMRLYSTIPATAKLPL